MGKARQGKARQRDAATNDPRYLAACLSSYNHLLTTWEVVMTSS